MILGSLGKRNVIRSHRRGRRYFAVKNLSLFANAAAESGVLTAEWTWNLSQIAKHSICGASLGGGEPYAGPRHVGQVSVQWFDKIVGAMLLPEATNASKTNGRTRTNANVAPRTGASNVVNQTRSACRQVARSMKAMATADTSCITTKSMTIWPCCGSDMAGSITSRGIAVMNCAPKLASKTRKARRVVTPVIPAHLAPSLRKNTQNRNEVPSPTANTSNRTTVVNMAYFPFFLIANFGSPGSGSLTALPVSADL